MINNVIIAILLAIAAFFYLRKRYGLTFVTAFVYLTAAPLLSLRGSEINSSYALTAVLFVLTIIDFLRFKKERPKSFSLVLFAGCMGLVTVAYTLGFFLHGSASIKSFIVAMAGELNVFVLCILLAWLLLKCPTAKLKRVVSTSIVAFTVIDAAMIFYQKSYFYQAYRMMDQLYVADSRFKPLFVMWKAGAFDRVSGTFYTPIVLGTTLLLSVALLTAYIVMSKKPGIRWWAVGLAMLMTAGGILAFSKTYMLGVPLLLVVALILIPFLREKTGRLLARLGVLTVGLVITYAAVYFLLPKELDPVKRYYYGFILNPFMSLETRYQGIIEPAVNKVNEGPMAEAGIAFDAFGMFRRSPIFGVGPLPVHGEFLGDSQFIVALHGGGILAALGYAVFYAVAFVRAFLRRNLATMLLVAVVAMGSFASVMLTLPSTLPFVALIIRLGSLEREQKGMPGDELKEKLTADTTSALW